MVEPPRQPDTWLCASWPQLWGWRSDLEMAATMGDVELVRMVAETNNRTQVKEFLEMRMVLTTAAELGHLTVCIALIDEFACLVDGVRDRRNKLGWYSHRIHTRTRTRTCPFLCPGARPAPLHGTWAVKAPSGQHGLY